jgi:hypothetical protein
VLAIFNAVMRQIWCPIACHLSQRRGVLSGMRCKKTVPFLPARTRCIQADCGFSGANQDSAAVHPLGRAGRDELGGEGNGSLVPTRRVLQEPRTRCCAACWIPRHLQQFAPTATALVREEQRCYLLVFNQLRESVPQFSLHFFLCAKGTDRRFFVKSCAFEQGPEFELVVPLFLAAEPALRSSLVCATLPGTAPLQSTAFSQPKRCLEVLFCGHAELLPDARSDVVNVPRGALHSFSDLVGVEAV